jgi:hypothetical protein
MSKKIINLFIYIFIFIYGLSVGHYHFPPHSQLASFKKYLASLKGDQVHVYKGKDQEILQFAFTDPLIPGELIHPPLTTLENVRDINESIFIPVENYYSAYDNLSVANVETLELNKGETDVVKLTFNLFDKQYEAYSYGKPSLDSQSRKAALILPGSGLNQSSAIYSNDPENYHYGVIDIFDSEYDIFVFIKPNEDILAFHDGQKKLNLNYYVNWHLNRGGSYSASYIAQSIAFTKHLKENYKKVAVVGLSQGGSAALLNSLQSNPEISVVASGYSSIYEKVEGSGFNQIIIPGIDRFLHSPNLLKYFNDSDTQFFFSWGNKETGSYRIEAEENKTCHKFETLDNITCVYFDGGHVFPKDELKEFLSLL